MNTPEIGSRWYYNEGTEYVGTVVALNPPEKDRVAWQPDGFTTVAIFETDHFLDFLTPVEITRLTNSHDRE